MKRQLSGQRYQLFGYTESDKMWHFGAEAMGSDHFLSLLLYFIFSLGIGIFISSCLTEQL